MKPSRVFVTGAAGFLGSAVVRALIARGVDVRGLVRRADRAASLVDAVRDNGSRTGGRLELVVGSLRDEPVDTRWLSSCDALVHAAGALRGTPSALVRQNVVVTRALIDAALSCRLQRFVLVSSMSVYGPHSLRPGAVLDEGCPIEPSPERRGGYVYSKVVQEAACWEAYRHRSLPLVVVRPGVIFGPGRSCLSDRVGPRLGRLVAVVDGDRPMPYTFIANCAAAVALAAITPGIQGEAFNLIDDQLPTAREIVNAYRDGGGDVRVLRVPRWATTPLSRIYGWCHRHADALLPPAFLPYVVEAMYKPLRFSNARAKAQLRWHPAVDLPLALEQTIANTHATDLHQ